MDKITQIACYKDSDLEQYHHCMFAFVTLPFHAVTYHVILSDIPTTLTFDQFHVIVDSCYSHKAFYSHICWKIGGWDDNFDNVNNYQQRFCINEWPIIVGKLIDVVELLETEVIDDDFSE